MNQNKKKVRIVSLTRLRRLGKQPSRHYKSHYQFTHYMDRFSVLANKFETHLDGGEAMYREWLRSIMETAEGHAFEQIKSIWNTYQSGHSRPMEIILLVDGECQPPPAHAVILKQFIESEGAKL